MQLGSSCFKVLNQKLPWLESNTACNSPQYLYSNSFTLSNIFLLNHLAEKLEKVSYWTGYYTDVNNDNLLSGNLEGFSVFDTKPIYDPVWADTQPRVDSDDRKQCVLFGSDPSDTAVFGWHLENCSALHPTICQTFACIKDVTMRCKDNTKCYPVAHYLDNIQDCADASDEYGVTTHELAESEGIITITIKGDSYKTQSWILNSKGNVNQSMIDLEALIFMSRIIPEEKSCSGSFSGNGSWSLPKTVSDGFFYPADLHCDTRIANPEKALMTIKILDFEIADGDQLKIYDGTYTDSNLLGEFSSTLEPPTLLLFSSEELNFIFQSLPNSSGAPGFRIAYEQGCLNKQYTAKHGQFETPAVRFPSKRSPFQCSWILEVPCNDFDQCQFTMELSLLELDSQDTITLSSADNSYVVTNKEMAPIRYRSVNNVVFVDIVSKSNVAAVVGKFSIDCPSLNIPSNTRVTYTHHLEYNSVAIFSCVKGYHLTGNSSITCEANGQWSNDIPKCTESFCLLPVISNGFVTNVTGYTVGSSLWYSCQLGYRPASDVSSVCSDESFWDPLPSCENVTCSPPEDNYKGCILEKTTRGNSLFSKAVYKSPNRLSVVGNESSLRVCQEDGSWTSPDFACKPTNCYTISFPYGVMEERPYAIGDRAIVNCDFGFQISEPPECLKSGNWSFQPRCKAANFCSLSSYCPNGTCIQLNGGYTCQCFPGYSLQRYENDSKATCVDIDECETEGYSLCDQICTNTLGDYSCSCVSGKLYDDPVPTDIILNENNLVKKKSCYTPRCGELHRPNNTLPYAFNYTIQNGLYLVNTSYTFVCNLQFTYKTKYVTMRCVMNSNGAVEWEQIGNCTEGYDICRPDEIHEGVVIKPLLSLYQSGATVHFECPNNAAYHLNGLLNSTCTGTTWSNKWPHCGCPKPDYNATTTFEISNPSTEDPLTMAPEQTTAYFVCKQGYSFGSGEKFVVLYCINGQWNQTVPECVDTNPISCGFDDSYDQQLVATETESCIQEISPVVKSGLGSEVILWCLLWRWHKLPAALAPQTIQYSSHKIGLYFQSIRPELSVSYECVVKTNDIISEVKITGLQIDNTLQPYTWINVLNTYSPKKSDIFDSTIKKADWQHSQAWSQSNEDSAWIVSRSSKEEWLISPAIQLASEHLTIVLQYDAKRCIGCYLKLLQYSTDQQLNVVNIEQFFTVDMLQTNQTTMEFQLGIQKKFLYVALQSKGLTAKIYSIKLLNISCPEIHLAHATFPRSVAKRQAYSVAGYCSADARNVQQSSPELYCSSSGRWEVSNVSSISCICSSGYIDTLYSCVKEVTRTSESELSIIKGCRSDCLSTFTNLTSCLLGNENCTLCCETDYCNWSPTRNRNPRIIGSVPHCLSNHTLGLKCQKTIFLRYDNKLAQPVVVQFPEVYGSSPVFNLSSNILDLGSKAYVFPSSIKSIEWKVQNNYGQTANCTTTINHIDSWAPLLQCPTVIETFERQLQSSEITLMLPTVNVVDFSDVQISTNPKNLSKIMINGPYLINITATDRFGNSESCSFWYQTNSLDCSPFMAENEDFYCKGDAKQLKCRRKNACKGREYPSAEFSCNSASTNTAAPNSSALLSANKNIFPLCIPQTTPHMILESTIKLGNLNGNKCLSLFLFEIQKAFHNEMSHYTNRTWKTEILRFDDRTITFALHISDSDISEQADIEKGVNVFIRKFKEGHIVIKNICGANVTAYNAQLYIICANKKWRKIMKNNVTYCEQCEYGSYLSNNQCLPCPTGTYSSKLSATECQQCPDGYTTLNISSHSIEMCVEVCSPGYFSINGKAPCILCDIGKYQSNYGATDCMSCPENTSTISYGSKSLTDCLAECKPGMFSRTGYEPCIECPKGFYQAFQKQRTCLRCPSSTTTSSGGAINLMQCKELSCGEVDCLNGGRCVDGKCVCVHGYSGSDCGVLLNMCSANYCLNSELCNYNKTFIRCSCKEGYYGERCERRNRYKRSLTAFAGQKCFAESFPYSAKNSIFNQTLLQNYPETNKSHYAPDFSFKREFEKLSAVNITFGILANQQASDISSSVSGFVAKRSIPLTDPCENVSCGSGICYVIRSCDSFTTDIAKCLCPPGTTGENCEQSSNACKNNRCKHGKCLPLHNNVAEYYFCLCDDPAYYGEYCDVFTPCSQNSQLANSSYSTECYIGTCQIDDNVEKAICKCSSGYTGTNCQNAIDYCDPNPCNHQTCHTKFNGYSCECNDNYTGKNCTIQVNPCSTTPCANGGTCTMISAGRNGKYACSCPPGWEGEQCNLLKKECTNALCAEDSTCVVTTNHSYVCFCPEGKKGQYCNEIIDYCEQLKPCLNNGTCISTMTEERYECDCIDGYTGKVCERKTESCTPNPCKNGGFCTVEEGRTYSCTCMPNYSGKNCEIYSNPCILDNGEPYCMNDGNCTDENGVPKCQCLDSFIGDQCDGVKRDNFNLLFTGFSSEKSIVSRKFDATILQELTLCFWVNPGLTDKVWNSNGSNNSTFLTVATFNLQSYGPEIISVSASGIRLEKSYVLPFQLSERQWHHVCLRVKQNFTIDVLINGAEFSHVERRLSSTTLPLLILLGKNTDNTEHFIGQISLVQLHNSAIDTEVIHDMYGFCETAINPSIPDELIIDWKDFTTVERQDTSVFVLYPGVCASGPNDILHHNYQITDKQPPFAVDCPMNIHKVSEKRLSVITWSPNECNDIFMDDIKVADCTSNYRSGDVFSWGDYDILYIARDDVGNIGSCHFKVTVAPKSCAYPDDPLHGKASFFELTTRKARQAATIHCDNSYLFAEDVPQFFTCDVMGRWTRSAYGLHYRFPSCSEYTSPKLVVDGLIKVPGKCSDAKKYELDLQDTVNTICKQKFMDEYDKEENCKNVLKVETDCGTRFKRSTNLSDTTDIDIHYSVEAFCRKPVMHLLNHSITEKFPDALHEMDAKWSCSDEFPMLYAKNSEYSCVKCSKGKFYNQDSGVCEDCPLNTYKEEEGVGECLSCPDNLITGTTGAMLLSDCYKNCTPGWYYSSDTGNCLQCGKGRYQMEYGTTECYPCPPGSTTSITNAITQDECNVFCPAGSAMNSEENCVLCSPGTYRADDNKIATCTSCDIGFTSEIGSKTPYECNIRLCPIGYNIIQEYDGPANQVNNSVNDICSMCEYGKYQNLVNQTSCIQCPYGMTTMFKGATSARDCVLDPSPSITAMTSPIPIPVASSVSWYIWIIIGAAALIIVLLLFIVAVVYRKRLVNFIAFWTSRDLKNFETTDYYRHETYSAPTINTFPSSTTQKAAPLNIPQFQMTEIYDQIFTGLQQMADGSEDSRSSDFDEFESYSRSRKSYPDNFCTSKTIPLEASKHINNLDTSNSESQDFSGNSINLQSLLQVKYFDPESIVCHHEQNQWHVNKPCYDHNYKGNRYPPTITDDDEDEVKNYNNAV
uniref:Sushi, von Willebrand factor type A, EGF and pentraxin domain-containing protein 1 n=1 Tax=Syphacia muris TaxID=451379 RepID=A0A0N5ARB9_9BILA